MATVAATIVGITEYATAKTPTLRDIAVLKDWDSPGVAISLLDDTDPVAPALRLSSNGVALSNVSAAKDHHQVAEADFAAVKTSVWWDIENCKVPKGCDANRIAQNIRSALLKCNYSGSLTIHAYGDTTRIPSSVQKALSSTGVSLNHVPAGVKDGSDKKILVDMMLWAMENPAPANLMLISGDRDYSYALHQLGMKRYNILLARPEKASEPLIAAAKTVWLWTSIATGDRPNTTLDHHRHHPCASEVLISPLVPKQAKRMDSYLSRGTKRCRSFCELCNVVCSNHSLTAHLSGKKHRAKAVLVARERPRVSNSTEPKSVWCGVCQIGFQSEARYENHILGSDHQNELEDQAEYSRKRVCTTPSLSDCD